MEESSRIFRGTRNSRTSTPIPDMATIMDQQKGDSELRIRRGQKKT